jgi:hypothetical protein
MGQRIVTNLVNEDTGMIFSEWAEAAEDSPNILNEDGTINMGDLYRAAQAEYGRCTSKVYVDTTKGPKAVGWYFVKRDHYGGSSYSRRGPETYLRGAWVTVEG